MQVASFQNIITHYGADEVLSGVNFQINSGEKLGLIGVNGSGKTTILRVLMGQQEQTSGEILIPSEVRVGYVPQYVEHNEDDTAMEFLLSDYRLISENLRRQEERLEQVSSEQTNDALRAYQRARDDYDRVEGDLFLQRAEAMLDTMALQGKEDQKVSSMSGGEKNVLSLARALLSEPDLLLLDEPANHLDYLGVAWLEDFLNRFKGAVLIVSHNRYLLDRVAGGILELDGGKITRYEGNYSAYRSAKLRQLLSQQSDYIANQKRLAKLEELVRRFAEIAKVYDSKAWGRRLRARRTQLEREKKNAVDKPELNQAAMAAEFLSEETQADIALQMRGYTRGFDNLTLFDNADMDIAGGETVALVGVNGSGKTTLLRDIVERGDWSNQDIRIGPSMNVGYSAQGQEVLNDDYTIVQEIRDAAPMTSQSAFALLNRFMFQSEDMQKRVGDLSGGERNRLQLARLMALKPNFMILDEPTNHLDIPSREAVEEALEDFQGTLLVVSHDRYFLDKIVNRVVEVQDKKLVSYPGNFSEFWRASGRSTINVVGRVSRRRQRREPDRVQRAQQRQEVTDLERRIHEAEEQKVELEGRMAQAFASRDHRAGRRAQRQLDRVTAQLEDYYSRWVALE
ncbi:MAG: ABC-F family ATP-binding cassette domain-containing protein [Chloroflexi bacterium]|nr:ABC-F family ATP-binding cassette domain-containing protein [Chloroflexota bacterium]